MKLYTPSQKVLENYAKVMVHFAVGNGKGVKKGDVVRVVAEESAKPLFIEIIKELYRSGAHVITTYLPSDTKKNGTARFFYEVANDEQLSFYARDVMEGMVKQIDHQIYVLSEDDKQLLAGIDPQKIMKKSASVRPYRELLVEKENRGKYSWTLCMYGTPAMAKEAGLSLKDYWGEIIKACFLDKKDPVSEWKKFNAEIEKTRKKLTDLDIKNLHLVGKDIDLHIDLGVNRKWLAGRGANIPSFEIFVSPDWRGTNGWVRFSEPLYRYGTLITGIELKFKDGLVIESKAKKGEKVLKAMIAEQNADKVGEFSLTDKRFSRITKFMAETLFDENVGGPFGNTHIALGNAYQDSYVGDKTKVTKAQWKKLGFNTSVVHTDIVSTADRTVTATLRNGSTMVIYKDGMFTL